MNLDYLYPEKQLPYPCKKCKKSFKEKRDYKVHLKTSSLHRDHHDKIIGITLVRLAY